MLAEITPLGLKDKLNENPKGILIDKLECKKELTFEKNWLLEEGRDIVESSYEREVEKEIIESTTGGVEVDWAIHE